MQNLVTESALREFVELIDTAYIRLVMLNMAFTCSKTSHREVKNTAATSEYGQKRRADLTSQRRKSNRTAATH